MTVELKCCGENNATPLVYEALDKLKTGGSLVFEPGEYHFYEEGARAGFFAPSNNTSGQKNPVFLINNCENVTLDGQGSTFVFHDLAFPFIIKNSQNITVKNLTVTTRYPSYALAEIVQKDEEGFSLRIDQRLSPYHTQNGQLFFDLEHHTISTTDRKLSLHRLEGVQIRYLFAGDCSEPKNALAAPYYHCDATEEGNLLRFTYRNDPNAIPCDFELHETVAINLEERRERDVFFLEDSSDIRIQNVTIHRGGGMGIIGQICENITVDKLTAIPAPGEPICLTADVLHFVQCSGRLCIQNCTIASSMDDACNIHGNYSMVERAENNCLFLRYGHKDHDHLMLYRKGDRLDIIDHRSLDIVAQVTVEQAEFVDDTGLTLRLLTREPVPESIEKGFLVENPARMPDIVIQNNHCYDFPHVRVTGAGKIQIENNRLNHCGCAVCAIDLAAFWYESGRIQNLTIRGNDIGPCRDGACIIGGVSGYDGIKTPNIHGTIRVENNHFHTEGETVLNVFGFRRLIQKGNTENGVALTDIPDNGN